MNTYFIHTIEFYRLITYSEFTKLNKSLSRFKTDNEYISLQYEKDGITISFRKCTDDEIKRKGKRYGYKLIIIFNPSRLIENNTYINRIWNIDVFISSIKLFNEKIKLIFEKVLPDISGIDDFVLSRIDITKDIFGIPENIIQEYIKTIRRFSLNYGYALNTQLEEKCSEFRYEDSVNIINNSRGIEFVLYNKHQATVDQKYPDEIQEYFNDVLRMELRCSRKFIKKKSKDLDMFCSLVYFYLNMQTMVKDIFYKIFSYGYNSCFLSHYWLEKVIIKEFDSKEKKKKKMIQLVNFLYRNSEKSLDESLTKLYPSKKSQSTIMENFCKLKLFPTAIQSSYIPYMQSIESLLEFEQPNSKEIKYYDIIRIRSRGKEVFIHQKA